MINLYSVFKFLHVVAVIVWLGGLFTTSIVTARVAREGNQSALASLLRQRGVIGRSVLGPAAGVGGASGPGPNMGPGPEARPGASSPAR